MECLEAQISDLISRSANGEPDKLIGGKKINEYVEKILSLAEISLWTTSGKVEAIVATYANDPERNDAFLFTAFLVSNGKIALMTLLVLRRVSKLPRSAEDSMGRSSTVNETSRST